VPKSSQLELLAGLVRYFDHYNTNNYDDALQVLDRLRLIPIDNNRPGDMQDLDRRFRELDPVILQNFADVLVSCMKVYAKKYAAVRADLGRGRGVDGAPAKRDLELHKILAEYRTKARALNHFTGRNQQLINLSGEAIAELMNLETAMS